MNQRAGFTIVFIFFMLNAFSQNFAKYSNEFLDIGVGARALSLSKAVVAGVDDVSAGYWNPAGLLAIETKYQLAGMHAGMFARIAKFDYLGASYKWNDSSVCALSLLRYGVDDIPNTLDLIDENGNFDYERIKYFSVADYAFIFSFARKLGIPGLSLGGNAKLIYRKQGDFANALGFGFDLGAQYRYKTWKIGAMAKDITSTFNIWTFHEDELQLAFQNDTIRNPIPNNSLELTAPQLIVGVSGDFSLSEKMTLTTEANLDFTFDGKRNVLLKTNFASINPRIGLQLGYSKMIFLRAGIGEIHQEKDFGNKKNYSLKPTFGIGLKYNRFVLDYALTDIGNKNFYSNIFSLSYAIQQ
ncbi:MAG: hypothetical protein CSA05_01890 [Bacteroidia bacterium]|nr:MAG: hypothetical protein CSA05_01890 [Bacteroidia bacterium]